MKSITPSEQAMLHEASTRDSSRCEISLALLAAKRYTIATASSTTVRLALGTKQLRLVQKRPAARRIWIQVSVLDSAGNRAVLNKKARLVLP